MARKARSARSRDGLGFWLIVLLVAAVFGLFSYRFGRDWLGKRLGQIDVGTGAPRIVAQGTQGDAQSQQQDPQTKAPAKAEVALEAREPTRAEVRAAEQKALDRQEPQDGAEANSRDASKRKDEPKAPDAGSADGDAAVGHFVVSVGSFAKAENARKAASKLEAQGYSPFVETVTREGRVWQRVSVAAVSSRREADKIKDALASEGYDARISSTP